jgi:hypothetical protein
LVNLTGLIDTLLGVVLLADIIATNARWQKIAVEIVAPAMLWLHGGFPLCVFLGATTVDVMKRGEMPKLFPYGFLVAQWCGWMAMLLEETVAYPRLRWFLGSVDLRYRRFGLILVLSGVTLQLVAGFMELGSIVAAG